MPSARCALCDATICKTSLCGAQGGGADGPPASCPTFRQVTPTAPDQLWLTDITFVRLRSHWIYLAVLIDAFSGKCIGWALGTRITTELTLEALQMAIATRRPKATLVHHSDRGSQYGSSDYQEALLERGLAQSFSRPGTPTDNPVCERFIGTLKREEIWLRAYVDLDDARNSIGTFILDYNQHRSHSSLGKRSPVEFERMYHQAALSQPVQAERWRRFFEQPNSPRYVMTAQVMPPSGAAS
jgi:putative transposase